MFWFLLFVVVIFAIIFGAIRIILGWMLPKTTVAKLDAVFDATMKFFFKLCIVALAALIIWVAVAAYMGFPGGK